MGGRKEEERDGARVAKNWNSFLTIFFFFSERTTLFPPFLFYSSTRVAGHRACRSCQGECERTRIERERKRERKRAREGNNSFLFFAFSIYRRPLFLSLFPLLLLLLPRLLPASPTTRRNRGRPRRRPAAVRAQALPSQRRAVPGLGGGKARSIVLVSFIASLFCFPTLLLLARLLRLIQQHRQPRPVGRGQHRRVHAPERAPAQRSFELPPGLVARGGRHRQGAQRDGAERGRDREAGSVAAFVFSGWGEEEKE